VSKKDLLAEFTFARPHYELVALKFPPELLAELRAYARARAILEGKSTRRPNISEAIRGLLASSLRRAAEQLGPWPRDDAEWEAFERAHAPKRAKAEK